MKTCKTCLITLPWVSFTAISTCKDGYRSQCKPCYSSYARNNVSQRVAIQALRRSQVSSKTCSRCKEVYTITASAFAHDHTNMDGYSNACRSCVRARVKRHTCAYASASDKPFVFNKRCGKCKTTYSLPYEFFTVDTSKKDGLSNRCTACVLQYAKENPHIVNAIQAKRRSHKLNATPAWADLKGIRQVYKKAAQLNKTTNIKWSVDHIDPLISDLVCGLHTLENLQVIPSRANSRKSNKFRPYRYCFLTNSTYYYDI